jgi:hypothetical protein
MKKSRLTRRERKAEKQRELYRMRVAEFEARRAEDAHLAAMAVGAALVAGGALRPLRIGQAPNPARFTGAEFRHTVSAAEVPGAPSFTMPRWQEDINTDVMTSTFEVRGPRPRTLDEIPPIED